jgi:multidrug efflux system outer membrane protein
VTAMKRSIRALVVIGASLCMTCCAVYKPQTSVSSPVIVPEQFSDSGLEPWSERWWETFGDDTLNELVARAFADNLDLRRAWARLVQADALARQAGSALWPQVNAESGAARTRIFIDTSRFPVDIGGLGIDVSSSAVTKLYSLGIGAAYEVDLWRRVASVKRAAELDLEATVENVNTIAVTIPAEVARLWFAIVELKGQEILLDEQVAVGKQFLDLVELRFSEGLASAVDVYQQRQQLAATRTQRPLVKAQLELLEHQLAVLLGQPPLMSVADTQGTLPMLRPLPETGVPADLLKRRPDIRAAELRVIAADYRVAAAVADRLPAIRLTGNVGYQANRSSDLFDGDVWTIATNLVAPIIDGGRRAAEVDRTKAVVDELLTAYGQALLVAFQEVEDALAQERNQHDYLGLLQKQVELARQTLDAAQARYVNGQGDYLPVLTALQSRQRLERAYLTAQRDLIISRIQLCRALGGSWTQETPARTQESITTNSERTR